MSEVSRSDVEKALWMASGWQADQRYVDTVMAKVDEYAAGVSGVEMPPSPDVSHILDQAHAEAARILGDAHAEAQRVRQSAVVEDPNRRRKCSSCGALKFPDRFGRDKRSDGGRRKQCKDCDNSTKRRRYAQVKAGVAA